MMRATSAILVAALGLAILALLAFPPDSHANGHAHTPVRSRNITRQTVYRTTVNQSRLIVRAPGVDLNVARFPRRVNGNIGRSVQFRGFFPRQRSFSYINRFPVRSFNGYVGSSAVFNQYNNVSRFVAPPSGYVGGSTVIQQSAPPVVYNAPPVDSGCDTGSCQNLPVTEIPAPATSNCGCSMGGTVTYSQGGGCYGGSYTGGSYGGVTYQPYVIPSPAPTGCGGVSSGVTYSPGYNTGCGTNAGIGYGLSYSRGYGINAFPQRTIFRQFGQVFYGDRRFSLARGIGYGIGRAFFPRHFGGGGRIVFRSRF